MGQCCSDSASKAEEYYVALAAPEIQALDQVGPEQICRFQ
jgi:hypothetical protein